MEYVFGTEGEREILKTKGDSHTDLSGFHVVERSYPDQVISDQFRIVEKLDSAEDDEGNCYDWYAIDSHYRVTDKTGPLAEQAAAQKEELEDALCEQDAAVGERLSAIEDAICELDEAINN